LINQDKLNKAKTMANKTHSCRHLFQSGIRKGKHCQEVTVIGMYKCSHHILDIDYLKKQEAMTSHYTRKITKMKREMDRRSAKYRVIAAENKLLKVEINIIMMEKIKTETTEK
jgi:hypothetical protein